ncbi:unnamed protein product [Cylicocyclus nassatus]|uniref:Protein root UVB sensitive/RUS domain-containing protein n=1 Tax=Cylicocyclus nassatus TaxID=53992 RepID=A0AA36MC22_CYLNA|nr:unnamed protein product [Cylicocyclus nassatus]
MHDVFIENYAGKPIRKVSGDSLSISTSSSKENEKVRDPFTAYCSSIKTLLINIFLPQGYPYSVSDDYIAYQVWDTVQAFASSMSSALATEAVLKGAGVGDKSASALAASLTWLAKDGLGMIGRITFGYFKGTELDYDCKKWRLVADILNDLAFFVDLLSPAFSGWFFVCACTASLLRCVVGVAGWGTRGAIIQHQARRNNLADVASKDGSQETMVNVSALVASLIMLPLVSGKRTLIWFLFMVFTAIHLFANYCAVRSLKLETLNPKRATILIRSWLSSHTILSVEECNREEPLFYGFGIRYLGCSLYRLLAYHKRVPSAQLRARDDYTLLYDKQRNIGWIALAENSSNHSSLKAIFDMEALAFTGEEVKSKDFEAFTEALKSKGWKVEGNNLGFDEWTYIRK